MFKQYCASCHGLDAKGHGPAVPALKVPPPDLTSLTKNNHGKFPEPRVFQAIKGDVVVITADNIKRTYEQIIRFRDQRAINAGV